MLGQTITELITGLYSKSWVKRTLNKVCNLGFDLEQVVTKELLAVLGNFLTKVNSIIKEQVNEYVTNFSNVSESVSSSSSYALSYPGLRENVSNNRSAFGDKKTSCQNSNKGETDLLENGEIGESTSGTEGDRGTGNTESKTETRLIDLLQGEREKYQQATSRMAESVRESARIREESARKLRKATEELFRGLSAIFSGAPGRDDKSLRPSDDRYPKSPSSCENERAWTGVTVDITPTS
jgi:hypothetical protein